MQLVQLKVYVRGSKVEVKVLEDGQEPQVARLTIKDPTIPVHLNTQINSLIVAVGYQEFMIKTQTGKVYELDEEPFCDDDGERSGLGDITDWSDEQIIEALEEKLGPKWCAELRTQTDLE